MMDLEDDKTACCRIHCHHRATNADNVRLKASTTMWAVRQVRRTGGLDGFGFVHGEKDQKNDAWKCKTKCDCGNQ